jgi:hypothetical protein
MPSNQVMPLFKAGKLHSGAGGPIVKDPRQAMAIRTSYLKKEGKVPTGNYGRAFK